MKVSGAELKVFMDTAWPEPNEHWYWDHEEFEDAPDMGVTYDTDAIGPLLWQGPRRDDPTNGQGLDLGSMIRKWRKERAFTPITVMVPKGREKQFQVAVKTWLGMVPVEAENI